MNSLLEMQHFFVALEILTLIAVSFVCSGSVGSKSAEHSDISSSGSEFLEARSNANGEHKGDPVPIHDGATCLGCVEGFRDGLTVHDELLGVPGKDRMICLPRAATGVQIVRVMKKYITDNPDKTHRATRYVAWLALAHAFPCKAGEQNGLSLMQLPLLIYRKS